MRSGLWISGAGGSGVLVARTANGSWSPPSGILLHTAGLGFLVGVDIYDCVLVINNKKSLESFMKLRATLGGEVSVVAGPVGVGGVVENDGKWKQLNRPTFTYMKSRGFYAGVQIDGTVVIERTDENERFYGEKLSAAEILAGKPRYKPAEIKMLMETLKLAEGRTDVDQELMEELKDQPAPSDVEVESNALFGIPEPDDPDPYGVLALEREGLEIREAGSHSRVASSQFEYRPSPTSPIFPILQKRTSIDTVSASNRGSFLSSLKRSSLGMGSQTAEMGTQTDTDDLPSPPTSPRTNDSTRSIRSGPYIEKEEIVPEPEDIDYTKIDLGPYNNFAPRGSGEFNGSGTTVHDDSDGQRRANGSRESDADADEEDNSDESEDEEEPVVFEAASATAPKKVLLGPQAKVVKARGSLVTIPPRLPPPLPPRSSLRASRSLSPESRPLPMGSPLRDGFESVDLNGSDRRWSSISHSKSSLEHLAVVEDSISERLEDTMFESLELENAAAVPIPASEGTTPESESGRPAEPEIVILAAEDFANHGPQTPEPEAQEPATKSEDPEPMSHAAVIEKAESKQPVENSTSQSTSTEEITTPKLSAVSSGSSDAVASVTDTETASLNPVAPRVPGGFE
jgi:lipid-binding SYLF domain-containing protein